MKGQVALEFSMMVMLAFIFFGAVLFIILFYIDKVSFESQTGDLQEASAAIRQELLLAAGAEEGYQRTFSIPDDIEGRPYTVTNTNSSLTLRLLDGTSYTRETPLLSGTLQKGDNLVRQIDGIVVIG